MFLTNTNHHNASRLLLTDLRMMDPEDNEWSSYQVEVMVTQKRSYRLEMVMSQGVAEDGVLMLDNIVLDLAPVLGNPDNMTE